MTDAAPLAYRAMAGEDPTILWERVKEASRLGYVTFGPVKTLVDPIAKTTLFMRLVIDPKRVERKDFFVTEESQLIHGDTTRAFCEEISKLVTEYGWKLRGEPELYFQSGEPAIRQMLCR